MTLRSLTARQLEVAEMVARGMRYKQIATELGIETRTVKQLVRQAGKRLDGIGSPRHKLTMFIVNRTLVATVLRGR